MKEFFEYLGESPWLLVALCAVFQVWAVVFTICKFHNYRSFLHGAKWGTYTDSDNLTLISLEGGSDEANSFVGDINRYIATHNGAVDYSVIRDKTERVLDAKYDFASSKLSVPTYIGLFGTFLGVYIGLKCFNYGLVDSPEGITDAMVKELVGGIIISMVTSLIGLLIYLLSNIYVDRFCTKVVDEDKERFYTFIQDEVLPGLGTNVTDSLNRLQRTIRKFEPSFRAVIDEFKDAFTACTDMFKGSFADNVSVLTRAVEAMGSNMSLINENIQKQEQLLSTLRQRQVVDTLDKFVEAASSFDSVTVTTAKLEDVSERISASSEALALRQESYNKSLEIPSSLLEKITAILDRVTTFEKSLDELGENMNQTQLFRNEQLNLIHAQIDALKAKTNAVAAYQDMQLPELQKIYSLQNDAVQRLASSFRQSVDQNASDVEKTMAEFKQRFNEIAADCRAGVEQKLEEFKAALGNSLDFVDANRKLANLDRLQSIEAGLGEIKDSVSDKAILSDISASLQRGNEKLDSLGRRTAAAVAPENGTTEKTRKKRRGFFHFWK